MSRKQFSLIMALAIVGLIVVGLATAFASPGGISTLGDFVWFDENGNGIKDEGPEWGDSGIDNVRVNLYLDDGDGVFEPGTDDSLQKTMLTGDNPGTTEVEHGWYDFTQLGNRLGWWVEIPDSNFDPGGPLEGYEYTGNNAGNVYNGPEPRYVYLSDTLTDYNDADFSYTLKNIVSVGNLVWFDPDNDGVYEPNDGETGINDISVYLFKDANGNGIPEPGGADGSAVATTRTASATYDNVSHDGIYQFLDLTPSAPGDPTTNYFVALSSADLVAKGYSASSTGSSASPLDNEDHDDGYPLSNTLLDITGSNRPESISASTYVVSKPFPLYKGAQSQSMTTTDWGDATGYADSSSYMTIDFGFIQASANAVRLTDIDAHSSLKFSGVALLVLSAIGLGAFVYRRQY